MASDPISTYGWTAVPRDPSILLNGKKNNKTPELMTVDEMPLPRTELVEKVMAYAKQELPEETFNHCMRVYYYGQAIRHQQFPDWPLSSETYLLTCLLHDIGTTPTNLNATLLSFEFHGGMLSHTLLTTLRAPTPQAEAVAEAVIRHQDIGTTGKITQLGQLIQLATIFDNLGEGGGMVDEGTVGSVVGAWPRGGWGRCFAGVLRTEIGRKPWANTTRLGEEKFPEGVERNEVFRRWE